MRRLTRIFGWAALICAALLFVDYQLVHAKNKRLASAVTECGGRMGSLPFWPLGAEYRITFSHPLTAAQLDTLTDLNSLRGSVTVVFFDCELSRTEIQNTVARLPKCALFRCVNSETTSLRSISP